jgi:hypothetical protein
MERSNPASVLLQPSRPTTATTSALPAAAAHSHSRSTHSLPAPPVLAETPLSVHPLFTKYAKPIPGTVRIKVEVRLPCLAASTG